MELPYDRKEKFILGLIGVAFVAVGLFIIYNSRPPESSSRPLSFEVTRGEGFREIARNLETQGVIRSSTIFEFMSVLTGKAFFLKAGRYELDPSFYAWDVLSILVRGAEEEVLVRVPEGASVFEIDELLSREKVLVPGELVKLVTEEGKEGFLFPDSYRFFVSSTASDVLQKFLENFDRKARPLLPKDAGQSKEILILASFIEKEVPSPSEAKIVAGILKKRLVEGMPLQVDAAACYVKLERLWRAGELQKGCYPLSAADIKVSSPYNTYEKKGLPPGPIGNPSLMGLQAVLDSEESPYWFYINDPKTGKTIFAATFEEHGRNIERYLR